MSVFVKICGVSNLRDAEAIAELRPDAMGFVLWPGSKRFVRWNLLSDWLEELPASILKVGVFVDAKPDEVKRVMAETGLHVAQLHGSEDVDQYIDPAFKLWKVVKPGIDKPEAVADWPVDAVMVDTVDPKAPGGTGKVGDWPAARKFVDATKHNVILAGGLTPANVRASIDAVRPWGVDVSTGVELQPGAKDLDKVEEFINACRAE